MSPLLHRQKFGSLGLPRGADSKSLLVDFIKSKKTSAVGTIESDFIENWILIHSQVSVSPKKLLTIPLETLKNASPCSTPHTKQLISIHDDQRQTIAS